jgi:hypothetical protein
MLSLTDRGYAHTCQGATRREFLQVGALSLLGGLSLPDLLRAKSELASAGLPVADKSVVLLFLQGGPPHIEFFDPKMSAPEEIRCMNGEVKTALPGITFGASFPKMARLANQLAIVRSYASGNAGHTYLSVTSGGNSLKAAMGALYAKVVGTTRPRTGMPTNIVVLPEAVQPGLKLGGNFETGALPTLTSPGELGPTFAAFNPSDGGQLKGNMTLKLPAERFDDRRKLLSRLDDLRRDIDTSGTMDGADKFQQQAFDVVTRGVAKAFDLSQEDPRTIDRYDTSKLFKAADVQKWYDMRRASNLLGKQLLLARRLCEAGAGFVTVSDCGWDMHANGNSPKQMAHLPTLAGQVDHAVAAFIEDVRERGLSDKILLVVTGEMGRTPRRNRDGGRDHYPNLTALALAGGGLKMGQVIGQSDKNAANPVGTRYTPQHLFATVMQTLLDVGKVRLMPGLGKAATVIAEGQPIDGLLS